MCPKTDIQCKGVERMKKRFMGPLYYFLTIVAVLAAAGWGSRTATVMAQNTPVTRDHCVVLDPGHGGEDGGAISCTGKLESSYNLEIALRLDDLFHLLGYETRMTRKTDTAIYTTGQTIAQKKVSDLKQRVAIVEETPGSILLSIHQNTFSDSRYSGAQVFYASTNGSQALAETLQRNLVESLNPGSNRKAKKSDGVYLMEQITRPGILIECGFLSNREEETLLQNPTYQKQLCCVIATTVAGWITAEENDLQQ